MSRTCFVISPIGDPGTEIRRHADQALKHLVKKALDEDFVVSRGDSDENPGAITPRIIAAIQAADIVVADMSSLNANVFYELAIAHGFGVPTVHIQRSSDRVPFDVKDMRVVRYDLNDPDELEAAQKQLRGYAKFAMDNPSQLETPLTSAGRFRAIDSSTDPVTESNKQVLEAIGGLASSVRRALADGRTSRTATTLQKANEDIDALRRTIDAIQHRGALEVTDLRDSITHTTSASHDDYFRQLLISINGNSSTSEQNRFLYTPELLEDSQLHSEDDEPDS